MRFIRCLKPVLVLAVVTINLNADLNPETGVYVFQRYSAKQYGASPQNWGVAEDQRGIMYFANTNGLLEFDGNSWRLTAPTGRFHRQGSECRQFGEPYMWGGWASSGC